MTVVNPKSISGINSITMSSGSDDFLTIHSNNTTERVRVNNSGDVIIGSGVTLSPDGDGFFTGVITATSYSGIDLSDVTGATGDFSIADKIVHTGDTNTALRFPAADTITAETGGSERLRIDSSGLVGLGTATTRAQLDVRKDSGNVIALFEGSNASQNHRVRIDTSGGSSTSALSISNSNSNNQTSLYHSGGNNNMVIMGGQTAGAEPTSGTTVATFASGGDVTVNTGNLIMGTSGKGIDFSATANSSGSTDNELFDDYEEGLFTPILSAASGSSTVTYQGSDNRRGRYVKIGKMVHVNYLVGWNDITSGFNGDMHLSGLPFAHENVEHADPNDYTQSVGACYFQNLTIPNGNNGHTVVYIWGGYSTYAVLMQAQNNGNLQVVQIDAGSNMSSSTIKYVQFTLTYPAA